MAIGLTYQIGNKWYRGARWGLNKDVVRENKAVSSSQGVQFPGMPDLQRGGQTGKLDGDS